MRIDEAGSASAQRAIYTSARRAYDEHPTAKSIAGQLQKQKKSSWR